MSDNYLTSDEHLRLMNLFYFCIFNPSIVDEYYRRLNNPLWHLESVIDDYYASKGSGDFTGD